MKVRTKKGIVDTKKEINKLNDSIKGLCNAANKTTIAVTGLNQAFYHNWLITFKPQKQYAIWIIQSIVLILAIAEIIWFVVTKL